MDRLFGTDGVRGVAGQWPLTPAFVERLGSAAGRVLLRQSPGRRRVLVVRDTRASGPALERVLARGLTASGLEVLSGDVLPTPAVAVLVPRQRLAAGAVVSASHNPAEFNGIKFFGPSGNKLPEAVEREIEEGLLSAGRVSQAGRAVRRFWPGARAGYVDFLKACWPRGLDLKGFVVALDCAHGATTPVAAELFRSLGAEVLAQSIRPDGRNINRNCGALFPDGLAATVLRRRAHVGVAFDGDGDRAIFVDETGAIRDGDHVLLAAARHLKTQGRLRENTVVVTVMSNLGLKRALAALDIRTVETPVGDKYVAQALEDTGAVLGGEQSGHTIFREFLGTGDGLLTALQVLSVMRAAGQPLSALTALAVRYPQVLLNVRVRERRPLESLNGFSHEMERVRRTLGDNGRLVVRYSGTEPLLRIMLEGPDLKDIRGHAQALARKVRDAGL